MAFGVTRRIAQKETIGSIALPPRQCVQDAGPAEVSYLASPRALNVNSRACRAGLGAEHPQLPGTPNSGSPGDVEPLPPVVLINMPFASVDRPSLGLGLLQAVLRRHRIPSRVLYLNMLMAERCGLALYEHVATGALSAPVSLFGEWLFSPWLISDHPSQEELDLQGPDLAYVRKVPGGSTLFLPGFELTSPISVAKMIRKEIPGFLDTCVSAYDWSGVQLVGLTSTFQQHVSSLVLARLIKGLSPQVVIVMGGANVEGVMGRATLEAFPWVDCVVSGEGERVIVPLARAVTRGKDWTRTPGLLVREQADRTGRLPCLDMDRLPYPTYQDYFDQLSRHPVLQSRTLFIPAETSRGCWWGARCQCTFCGLNGERLEYRHKSADRAFNELMYLWRGYGGKDRMLALSDNNTPVQHFSGTALFSRLQRIGARLACEVKASLTKGQICQLKQAGFCEVQAGIESLSTRVLKLMRKGTTALVNVQFLKWSLEYGVSVNWHILWGFPGEEPSEYKRMAELIPRLFHLAPPRSLSMVRLDRFSPMFNAPAQFEISDLRPKDSYSVVYKKLPLDLIRDLAYYFDFAYVHRPPDGYCVTVGHAIAEWRRRHGCAGLFYFPLGSNIIVVDTRHDASIYMLEATWGQFLDAMDSVTGVDVLAQSLGSSSHALETKLRVLDQLGWIVREGDQLVGLPVKLGDYQPSAGVISAMSTLLDETGTVLRPVRHIGDLMPAAPAPAAGERSEPGSGRLTHPMEGRPKLEPSMFRLGSQGTIGVDPAMFARLLSGRRSQPAELSPKSSEAWFSVDFF